MNSKNCTKITLFSLCIVFLGCSTANYAQLKKKENLEEIWKDEPQIESGTPNIVIDGLGNVMGIPSKIILLNSKIDRHKISPETTAVIEKYIKDNPEEMKFTKIRLNQFAPVGEFRRLAKNKKISWWWRIFPGIPVTIFSLGGRLFGGDNYNPYTDTINIYSDVPVVTLHEAGHAVDYDEQAQKGNGDYYALGRMFTPVVLHQEQEASDKAVKYLEETKDREGEKQAYKTLYPAYGTYVGGATGIPFANVAGAAVGHVAGIIPRVDREKAFQAFDEAKWSEEITTDINADPVAKSLLEEHEKRESLLRGAFSKDSDN